MKYRVFIKKMPLKVQKRMGFLVDYLKENGPVAHNWPNYSKLSTTDHHSIPQLGGVLAYGRWYPRNRGVSCRLS